MNEEKERKTAFMKAAEKSENSDNTAGKVRKKRRGAGLLFPFIAVALIVLTGGAVISAASEGMLKNDKEVFVETEQSAAELSAPSGKFLGGISVQGVDLGGRTMKEAQEVLCIEESELIPSINYTLTCHDKIVYLTEDDFEYDFDTVSVLNRAYEYSEYMRRTLTKEGRTQLRDSEKKDYSLNVELNDNSIENVCKEVAKKVDVTMQNAHATKIDVSKAEVSEMFTFAEGITGYDLDEEDLQTQISTLIANETYTADIIAQMEIVEPTYTILDLKKNLVLISMYTTYSTNDWAGNSNMDTAMKTMNGSIIKNGETFSFNEHTGNSNLAENGYYGAGIILNGKSATGIGGGICQAATTIYNAAIRAGMTVVERSPHTWPSEYVPVGIDSAIDYGNIDMKFANNTGNEVYLICYMEGAQLYAYIYGYKPDDFDEITISSWFTGAVSNGFGAAASRTYYKNGKEVKTEDLPSSYYENGGGTSYAYTESPTDYKFKNVFTSAQIAAEEKKSKQTEDNGSGGENTDSAKDTDASKAAESDADSSQSSSSTAVESAESSSVAE